MTSTTTEELREQLLSAVRKSQGLTLDAIKTAVDAASRVTHKIPTVKLPGNLSDRIPAPESVVSGAYGFAEKLLAEQRKFAGDVLKATAALRPSAGNTGTASDDALSDDTVSREPASDDATTPDSPSPDAVSPDAASPDTVSTDSASQDTATTDTHN